MLERGYDADFAARMPVIHADASDWLASLAPEARPQVVFVDPMFPDTGKKAAAKKDMQAFQEVIGGDDDSPRLLAAALAAARERVVVKRPRLGADVAGPPPTRSPAPRGRPGPLSGSPGLAASTASVTCTVRP